MQRYIYLFLALLNLAFGIIYLNDIYNEVEEKTMSQLLKQQEIFAVQAAEGIETFFENCKNSLKYVTGNEKIINSSSDMHEELKRFYLSFEGQITAVSRIDKNGILIDTYPKSDALGKDLSHQQHNKILKEEQRPVISDVIDVVQGYKAVVYSYPVWKDGEYNGGVGILIPYRFIANKFLKKIKIGSRGYAFVISENGTELFHPHTPFIGKSIFENIPDNPDVHRLAREMLEAKPGTTRYFFSIEPEPNKPEIEKLAFYYPVYLENTFWSIAVVISKQEVLAVNKGFNRSYVITIVIISILLTILISLYFFSKRKADLKLKEEEEKYKTILEQTGQIVYNTNLKEGTIKLSGACKDVIGYELNKMKSMKYQSMLDMVHPDERAQVQKTSEIARKEKKNFNQIFRLKHKNGDYIYVEDNGTCLQNFRGEFHSMVGTIKDISDRIRIENLTRQKNIELEKLVKERTEELDKINKELQEDIQKRKQTEEELKIAKLKAEKSDKLKSEFLAQMSHEIRTPVSSLLSFSSLIKEETRDNIDPTLAESFDVIDNAGRRIIRTIDLILNMSQIQTGSYEAKFQKFDLYRVINNIYNEYKKIAGDKGLELIITEECTRTNLHADEYTVFQIFNNLVDNAVKYTQTGNVEITLNNCDDKKLNVEVKDTGIGISEDYLPNIFNAFSQEQQGYTRKYDGNGLGLALVKRYCEINNAMIKVESAKGIGTKFEVIFDISE